MLMKNIIKLYKFVNEDSHLNDEIEVETNYD